MRHEFCSDVERLLGGEIQVLQSTFLEERIQPQTVACKRLENLYSVTIQMRETVSVRTHGEVDVSRELLVTLTQQLLHFVRGQLGPVDVVVLRLNAAQNHFHSLKQRV